MEDGESWDWLGKDVGFQYCLSLIEKLHPTRIFNCHVEKAFTFTPEELHFMQRNLERRLEIFGDLFPWTHPNQGMDPYWVRTSPYQQEMTPGQRGQLKAVVTNHSDREQTAECRLHLPHSWGGSTSAWTSTLVPAGAEKEIELSLEVPQRVKPGRQLLTLDVNFGDLLLPQFSEAIVDSSSVHLSRLICGRCAFRLPDPPWLPGQARVLTGTLSFHCSL